MDGKADSQGEILDASALSPVAIIILGTITIINAQAVVRASPIPLSFLHPRWLLDGPPVVREWAMSYRESEDQ